MNKNPFETTLESRCRSIIHNSEVLYFLLLIKRAILRFKSHFSWAMSPFIHVPPHSQKREIIHCFDLLSNSSSYSKSPQVHQSFIFNHFNHFQWLWKTLSLWGKSGKRKTVQNCTSPFCPAIQVETQDTSDGWVRHHCWILVNIKAFGLKARNYNGRCLNWDNKAAANPIGGPWVGTKFLGKVMFKTYIYIVKNLGPPTDHRENQINSS